MTWKGPFVVSKELAPDVFEVLRMEAGVPTAYHRSKLKCYQRMSSDASRLSPSPAPLKFVDGKVEYEIEEITDHREVRGKRQYLLQWKDTPETSWEWESNLSGCLDLLKDYLVRIGEQGRVLPPGLTSAMPPASSSGSSLLNPSSPVSPSSSTIPRSATATSPPTPLPPPRRSTRRRGNHVAF